MCIRDRNITDASKKYTLEIRERSSSALLNSYGIFSSGGSVDLTMSQPIYDAWDRGGRRVKGVVQQATNTFHVATNDNSIQAVSLNPGEFERILIKVNAPAKSGMLPRE